MEKRRVTITVGGQPYSFVSDDSDEYIRTLEQRTNAALKQTAGFAPSVYAGAILSVISQTDRLLREEKSAQTRKTEEPEKPQKAEPAEKQPRKEPGKKKASTQEKGQVSVWDLLEEAERVPERAAEATGLAKQAERMPKTAVEATELTEQAGQIPETTIVEATAHAGQAERIPETAVPAGEHAKQTKSARKDQL